MNFKKLAIISLFLSALAGTPNAMAVSAEADVTAHAVRVSQLMDWISAEGWSRGGIKLDLHSSLVMAGQVDTAYAAADATRDGWCVIDLYGMMFTPASHPDDWLMLNEAVLAHEVGHCVSYGMTVSLFAPSGFPSSSQRLLNDTVFNPHIAAAPAAQVLNEAFADAYAAALIRARYPSDAARVLALLRSSGAKPPTIVGDPDPHATGAAAIQMTLNGLPSSATPAEAMRFSAAAATRVMRSHLAQDVYFLRSDWLPYAGLTASLPARRLLSIRTKGPSEGGATWPAGIQDIYDSAIRDDRSWVNAWSRRVNPASRADLESLRDRFWEWVASDSR